MLWKKREVSLLTVNFGQYLFLDSCFVFISLFYFVRSRVISNPPTTSLSFNLRAENKMQFGSFNFQLNKLYKEKMN